MEMQLLNKQGRSVLIKSGLNNLPTYWMQFFKMPASVIRYRSDWKPFFFGVKLWKIQN